MTLISAKMAGEVYLLRMRKWGWDWGCEGGRRGLHLYLADRRAISYTQDPDDISNKHPSVKDSVPNAL